MVTLIENRESHKRYVKNIQIQPGHYKFTRTLLISLKIYTLFFFEKQQPLLGGDVCLGLI